MAGNVWTSGGAKQPASKPAPASGVGSDSWMRDRLMGISIARGTPGYFWQQGGNYGISQNGGPVMPAQAGLLDIAQQYGSGGAGGGGGTGGGVLDLANMSPSPWAPIENQVIANRLGWNDLSKLKAK